MPVIAGDGPEAHAEAAWQKLHTPGTNTAARSEAARAFAVACRAIEEHGPPAVERLSALTLSTDPAVASRADTAARILAEVGTTEAIDALVDIALSPDIAVATMPSRRCRRCGSRRPPSRG